SSLVRDEATPSIGPRLGWLPADLAAAPWMFVVTYDDTSWTQSIVMRLPDGSELDINMGSTIGLDLPASAKQIKVRGIDARYAASDLDWIAFTVPGGVKVGLQLDRRHAATAPDDLVRIAEQLDLGPWPDMSWVGTR